VILESKEEGVTALDANFVAWYNLSPNTAEEAAALSDEAAEVYARYL